jgi:hypothetical protein
MSNIYICPIYIYIYIFQVVSLFSIFITKGCEKSKLKVQTMSFNLHGKKINNGWLKDSKKHFGGGEVWGSI